MTCKIRQQLNALLVAIVCCVGSLSALSVEFPAKPTNTDFFVDRAHLLKDDAQKVVNETASALLKEEQIALFVVTIPSLSSFEASALGIEGYATELFNHWGIGSQERNYGMLLLVSAGDRKARIELGAGFEHNYDNQSAGIMQSLIIHRSNAGISQPGSPTVCAAWMRWHAAYNCLSQPRRGGFCRRL